MQRLVVEMNAVKRANLAILERKVRIQILRLEALVQGTNFHSHQARSIANECVTVVFFLWKIPKNASFMGVLIPQTTKNYIFLYQIPFWDESSSDAVKRRKKWVDFVRRRRYKWTAASSSVVCSKHLTLECFEYGSATVKNVKPPD